MVSVYLPSDAFSQHLLSYLGFSYLGRGVCFHGCSSKVQPLLLALDKEYLLMPAPPDLELGVAPLSPPVPCITSWEIDGETVEAASDFILGGSRITADGDCSH